MTTLIINRWPLAEVPYHAWLEPATDAILFSPRACIDVDQGAMSAYAEVVLFDGPPDPSWELVAAQRFGDCNLRGVIALAERDIILAGRIRDRLCVEGQGLDSALAYRDKLSMKNHLRQAEVPVARFCAVDSAGDLLDFWESIDGPIVVKPRRGGASSGVRILRSMVELIDYAGKEDAFRDDRLAGLLAEEYLEHTLYQANGLVRDGIIDLSWVSIASTGMGFESGRTALSITLDADAAIGAAVNDLAAAALRALPSPDLMLFHAEIFALTDGRLFFNEVGSRIGGDQIRETHQLAYDIDLVELFVRLSLGQPAPRLERLAPRRHAGHAHLPPVPGTVRSVPPPTSPDNNVTWEVHVQPGDVLGTAQSAAQAMIDILAVGETTTEVEGLLQQAVDAARNDFVIY